MKTLTEPGQEMRIDFTGKLHTRKINGVVQSLIAIDRFSKWPTVKTCNTAETKEVINFLTNNFNLYGIPEKIKSDKGGAFISKEYREFCKKQKPKYRTRILYTPFTYAKRSRRTGDTTFEKLNANQPGRRNRIE